MVAAESNKITTVVDEDYELLPDNVRADMSLNCDSKISNDSDNSLETETSNSNRSIFKKYHIVWRNVILFALLHLSAIYGFYLMFTSAKFQTSLFAFILYKCGGIGITAGAHRLWAHRAYKAKTPMKLILLLFNTLAFQDPVLVWARDHRVHHKYTETNADPHNAKNGFFFAHVGWLLCRKHPEVSKKGKLIDNSDLESCPLLQFQKKHYIILMVMICFVLPTIVPMVCWNESYKNSMFVATLLRYTFTLNITWLVNSAAHLYGPKPYDKSINPVENTTVSLLALGEGFHNYHHTFPWDYKTSELKYYFNFTTAFINCCAKIGWAYDLKTVSREMIEARVKRTGDGSHPIFSSRTNAAISQPNPKTE